MSFALLKKLGIAAGVLLLLLVVYLFRQVPHSTRPFAKAVDQATTIRLMRGDHGVELNKTAGTWWVQEPVAKSDQVPQNSSKWPAANDTIKTLLDGIQAMQLEDLISDRPERQAEFEVDPSSGLRIVMWSTSSGLLVDGMFGKQAPDMAHIYFRYYDKPGVYLARGILPGDLGGVDVNSWRSHQLIDIPEMKIQAITIQGKNFKTELVRTSTDVWTMNGTIVDPAPVNALIGILAHLRCSNFIDPVTYPAITPESLTFGQVIVKSADAAVELNIGPEDLKSKQFPVSTGPDMGLAWLSEPVVHSIQQKPSAFKEKK